MKFSLFIARRAKLNTQRNRSTSTIIAIVGIALAVIVMELAITIVLGFKQEIKNKVIGFDSQITISPYITGDITSTNDIYIPFNDSITSILKNSIPNVNATLTLKQPGILKTDTTFAGVLFKGYDQQHNYSFEKSNTIAGNIPDFNNDVNKNKIVISNITATNLHLNVGDKINTYFFADDNIRVRKFEVAGIYDSKFSDYDRLIAYAPLHTLQKIARTDSCGSCIELRNINYDSIYIYSERLQQKLVDAVHSGVINRYYSVNNIRNSAALYFNWLDLLDTNVIVILILMACVSAITLISCLFIIILERIKMIGLLKALGATNSQIRHIFIYIAERLVLKGILIGNVIALSLILIQANYHIIPLDPNAYYLSYVPIEINWWQLLVLNICVVLVSILILIIPSHLASKINPVQTMRYE